MGREKVKERNSYHEKSSGRIMLKGLMTFVHVIVNSLEILPSVSLGRMRQGMFTSWGGEGGGGGGGDLYRDVPPERIFSSWPSVLYKQGIQSSTLFLPFQPYNLC